MHSESMKRTLHFEVIPAVLRMTRPGTVGRYPSWSQSGRCPIQASGKEMPFFKILFSYKKETGRDHDTHAGRTDRHPNPFYVSYLRKHCIYVDRFPGWVRRGNSQTLAAGRVEGKKSQAGEQCGAGSHAALPAVVKVYRAGSRPADPWPLWQWRPTF